MYGAGRGGVNIAPSDDKADALLTGINTPLLFPNATCSATVPMLPLRRIANIPAGSTNTGGGASWAPASSTSSGPASTSAS